MLGRLIGGLLNFPDLGAGGRIAADQVQGTPGQQGRYRAEVRGEHRAPQSGRFKGNRPAATDRIAHPRNMAEAPPAQLLYQFREVAHRGSEVGVDLFPGVRRRSRDLLRALTIVELFAVAQPVEGQALHQGFFRVGQARSPARFRVAIGVP